MTPALTEELCFDLLGFVWNFIGTKDSMGRRSDNSVCSSEIERDLPPFKERDPCVFYPHFTL